jgi:hypothetical protein
MKMRDDVMRWNRFKLTGPVLAAIALLALLALSTGAAAEGLPTITFVSPEGWSSGQFTLEVTITGDVDPGEVYYGIDEDEPTTQMTRAGGDTYKATVDSGILADGPHTITVKALNSTGQAASADLDIAVDNHSPAVYATSVHQVVSGDYLFTGTAEDAYINESAVYVIIDGDRDGAKDNVMTRVDDHFEFVVDTTQLTEGEHLFRLWAFDLPGNNNQSYAVGINVDRTPPVVTIVSEGGAHSVQYMLEVTVDEAHLDSVMVAVGDASPVAMGEIGGGWEWLLDLTQVPEGELTFTVTASDTVGLESTPVSITITVDQKADLEIFEVDWAKIVAGEGETLKVVVTVGNVGTETAVGFDISVLSEGKTHASVTDDTGLVPGEEKVYTIEWEAKNPGKWTVWVQVDVDDAIDESDETTNQLSEDETLDIKAAEPGMGAAILILALAGAVAILGRRR